MKKKKTKKYPQKFSDEIYELPDKNQNCPFCGSLIMDKTIKIERESSSDIFKDYADVTVKRCEKCKKNFISKAKYIQLCNSTPKFIFKNTNKLHKHKKHKSKTNTPEASYDANRQSHDYVIVYKSACTCLLCNKSIHNYEMDGYTLLVNSVNGDIVKIPVDRCRLCGQFYISETVLRNYEKRYGILLFERQTYENFISPTPNGYQQDTVLSRCGYSTKIENDTQRQSILIYIVESKKASVAAIKSLLSHFIKQRQATCPYAATKWERDLKYISDYKINSNPKIYKLEFVKKSK